MAINLMAYEACMQALKDHDSLNAVQLNSLVTQLEQERDELKAENQRLREKYDELIHHVATVYPGETRHQTALRYIKEAEKGSDAAYEEQALGGTAG